LSTCVGVVARGAISGTIRGSELQAASDNRHSDARQAFNRTESVMPAKMTQCAVPLGALPNRLCRQVA
jgi:hypothetical protein